MEVFPQGSEMDVKPGKDAEEYAEYCRTAGWEFEDSRRRFCIFRKTAEDALSIVTEEERFKNIRKAEWKRCLMTVLTDYTQTEEAATLAHYSELSSVFGTMMSGTVECGEPSPEEDSGDGTDADQGWQRLACTLTEPMYYILIALTEECCGVDIMEKVQRISKGRVKVGPGTLYAVLSKFEDNGIIRRTAEEGRRKSYIITESGRQR